ncbi:MAG: Bug family tripartite tricarboxylate transporter substrate binding protein, partial [Rhodanobacter sp.]
TLGTSGIGGNSHLAIELLKTAANVDVRDVAYKGTGPAINDALGGHLTGVMADLPGILELVKSKKIIALAVTSEERDVLLPEVATAKEQGLADLVAVNWFAVMVPKGTPEPIVAKLHDAVVKATQSEYLKDRFKNMGVTPQNSESPVAFTEYFNREYDRWGSIIKASGIRVN